MSVRCYDYLEKIVCILFKQKMHIIFSLKFLSNTTLQFLSPLRCLHLDGLSFFHGNQATQMKPMNFSSTGFSKAARAINPSSQYLTGIRRCSISLLMYSWPLQVATKTIEASVASHRLFPLAATHLQSPASPPCFTAPVTGGHPSISPQFLPSIDLHVAEKTECTSW
jgi:hypothetical protein